MTLKLSRLRPCSFRRRASSDPDFEAVFGSSFLCDFLTASVGALSCWRLGHRSKASMHVALAEPHSLWRGQCCLAAFPSKTSRLRWPLLSCALHLLVGHGSECVSRLLKCDQQTAHDFSLALVWWSCERRPQYTAEAGLNSPI